jgi:chloramphenicol 3-O-phosphotransferase
MDAPSAPGAPGQDASRTAATYEALAAEVLARPPRRGRTRVVAVDGGSASGKSTFAGRLAAALDAPVVHTDDVAWWESFFDWWPLLVEGVLEPLAAGHDVRFRPPAWEARGRAGAIEVAVADAVVVEGVGAGRRELADRLDLVVWVDVDRQVAKDRGLARPGEDPAFWLEWEVAEEEHLDRDRPWERADVLVSHDPPPPEDAERTFWTVPRATWRRGDRPT